MSKEDTGLRAERDRLAAENAQLRATVEKLEGAIAAGFPERESAEQHRLLLDGVRDYAIFMLDVKGRFAIWPKAAERVLGFSNQEMAGKPLAMLLTPEDAEAGVAVRALARAEREGSAAEIRWYLARDGRRFWGSGVIAALRDDAGSLRGFVTVIHDNTREKTAEEALKKAKAAAEAANAAKDHFLATVSHELRTPLAAMLLWAKLLEEEYDPSPARMKEGLEAIRNCAEEQRELIEDLVDTSRIVAGKLRLELKPTNLPATVRSAVDAVKPAAAEKNLTITEQIDPEAGWVLADPHRLQQVVWNLLNNSVKFTPAAGRIDLGVHRRGGEVEILVTDNGIGIPADTIGRIFDRFGQEEQSSSRESSGLGLGLSICHQLVGLHGGTISAHSPGRGQGATFRVTLPLPPIDPEASSGGSNSPIDTKARLNGQRVLLVEDTVATRKALALILREAGAEVMAFDRVVDAVAGFKQRRPDLIVSDIGLPTVDGHEFIQLVRAHESTGSEKPVPALALTAYADESNRRRAIASGFQKCLTKPIEPKRLISVLAKFGDLR